jgi:hypothetical protein
LALLVEMQSKSDSGDLDCLLEATLEARVEAVLEHGVI